MGYLLILSWIALILITANYEGTEKWILLGAVMIVTGIAYYIQRSESEE